MTVLERSPSFALDLDIHPLAGRIGAEIGNVRLAGDLPDPTIASIEAAVARHKVIFSATRNISMMPSRNVLQRGSVTSLPIRQPRGAPALPFWSLIRLMAAGVPIAGTPT